MSIVFILPLFNKFLYGHRAAVTFFKYTPVELNPQLAVYDDASTYYKLQNWDSWYEGLPLERIHFHRYPVNGGLTRSWNAGLTYAKEIGATHAVAGNSDILFTPGWHEDMIRQLEQGYHLLGPVTNTPGKTRNQGVQLVHRYFPNYKVTDKRESLHEVARHLTEHYAGRAVDAAGINGFCMYGKVQDWWSGAFDSRHVFDPSKKMTGNEDELQRRWRKQKRRIGVIPSSFIFHYRAVSRGDKHKYGDTHRIEEKNIPL